MSVEWIPHEYWAVAGEDLIQALGSTPGGLDSTIAATRRLNFSDRPGARRQSNWKLLLRQFGNPLLLLLLAAAAVSMALAERVDSLIILVIVIGSGLLGFVQERGAVRAVEALRRLVTTHVNVRRDGILAEMTIDDVVPGDIILLSTGDVVPGDCIVVESNRLTVDESVLSGEAFPVRKEPGTVSVNTPLNLRSNCIYLGSHVASGSAVALVLAVGRNTRFGSIEKRVAERHLPTSFERGVTAYGLLLIKATAILVIGVFALNLWLDRSVSESTLFSLALAVGLAPQMLPAIVTLSLSIGARLLAARKVVVKRLDSIEDFGSVDILCTDKTGTLTEGSVRVKGAFDSAGIESRKVLKFAYWNARLQEGHLNTIDDAISHYIGHEMALPIRISEIPFDFSRKIVSVVIDDDGQRRMISKGAVEQIIERCTRIEFEGEILPLDSGRAAIQKTFSGLSESGLRVLGVASKEIDASLPVGGRHHDIYEDDLTFIGFVAFTDPPKEGTRDAISRLGRAGVTVKIITGDNREISRLTARSVGLETDAMLCGLELSSMSDEELSQRVEETSLFVEVDPLQKERIILSLSARGHTVGFLGDGVNDVAALHAADVGISVDTGVDVAKETADLILLDKSLTVISDGIEQGRRVFANTLKYVYVTTSANFGNMVSLALATAFLPFLPMLPLQILLLNFLSDVPGMTIATDNVDPERLETPQRWDISHVRRFMIVFGLLSTTVDLATFAILRLVFDAGAVDLRTGWFLVSVLTEIVAMIFLRTSRHVRHSRPSRTLLISSLIVIATTVVLVMTPAGLPFRFEILSLKVALSLIGLVVAYAVITEFLKVRFSSLIR